MEVTLRFISSIALTLLVGLPASAALVTSTDCSLQAPGVSLTASGATSCSLNPADSRPSSSATVTVGPITSIPISGLNGAFFFDIAGSTNAVPLLGTTPSNTTVATAQANASLTLSLATPGPIRSGLMAVTVTTPTPLGGGPGNNGVSANLQIGNLSGSCNAGVTPFCQGLLLSPTQPFVFQLGQPFSLNFSERFSAIGDFIDGTGFSQGRLVFSFRFLEADGTTPVTLLATPEPSQYLACAGTLALVGFLAYRRRHVTT